MPTLTGATVYVPAQDAALPRPRLRGSHCTTPGQPRSMPRRSDGDGHEIDGQGLAQPPPGRWLAQLPARMPNHAPLQLN